MAVAKKSDKNRNANSFEAVAKRFGCNESEEEFEGKLRRIAKVKPKKSAKK